VCAFTWPRIQHTPETGQFHELVRDTVPPAHFSAGETFARLPRVFGHTSPRYRTHRASLGRYNKPPMPPTLSPLSLAAQQQVATPYYGLVWLALAQLAYTDEAATVIPRVGTDLPTAVANLPDLPPPPGVTAPAGWCRWRVEWGPVVTPDNGNLMYAAVCREQATGLPLCAALCIRGTDTQEHGELRGLLQEVYEDLDVAHTVPWATVMSDPGSPCIEGKADVAIAKGTCDGLKILRGMTAPADGGGTTDILSWVETFAAAHAGVPIVVTGHSLGACQATVMAAFLHDSLTASGIPATIVPHAFAPPTAGTPGFAAKFDAAFPGAHIWWNTLDIVPNAFQNIPNAPANVPSMTHMTGFWKDYGGPAMDDIAKLAVDGFIHLEHAYAQPTVNTMTLIGSVVLPGADSTNTWANQVLSQHLAPQYHHLISTQCREQVAAYPLPGTPPTA